MAKLLKWAGIVIGILLVAVIIGIVALPFVLPLDKIKDFAAAKISESIHHRVTIDKASFNIFSGIRLEKLSISNRPGFAQRPFVSADAIELRYAFWPLFSRQLVIKEVRLVKPEILVEKSAGGEFNFSDMMESKPSTGSGAKPPFDIFINEFSVRNGKLSYVDKAANSSSEIKDLNVGVSGFALALVKPISAKASANVIYQGKAIPVSLNGNLGVDLPKEALKIDNFVLSIAGESLSANGSVSNWKTGPAIILSLRTGRLNFDPLLAVFAGSAAPTKKAKPRPGELTASLNKSLASFPRSLSLKGDADLSNITLQNFKVDRFKAGVNLAGKKLAAELAEVKFYDGLLTGRLNADLNVPGIGYSIQNLKLAGFNSTPFSNSIVETFLTKLSDYQDLRNKVYGTLDVNASLRGRGVEPQDILANLNGSGSFVLNNGELKRVKTLSEVGKTIKSNSLQDNIKFGQLSSLFTIADQLFSAKDFKLDSTDYKIRFNGGADLGRLVWVPGNRLGLKLAPSVTQGLPKETELFRDKSGWLELTFELTGELKKPLPRPILDKPLEAAVGKLQIKIDAQKVEIEKSVKEKAKKQLQNLIKF